MKRTILFTLLLAVMLCASLSAQSNYSCADPTLACDATTCTWSQVCTIIQPPPPPPPPPPILQIGAIPLTGTVGILYSAPLSATGGTPPYSWTATGLPPGIKLTTAGVTGGSALIGIPTTAGSYSVTLGVKDSLGNTGTANPTITVSDSSPPPPPPPPPPQPLTITTQSLPTGQVSKPYDATLTATGGQLPYTWQVTMGALPTGLSLNPPTGEIAGFPTILGVSQFIVTVTDAAQATAPAQFTIPIKVPGSAAPYGAGLGCSPQSGPACPLAPDGSYSWAQAIPRGQSFGPFTDALITVNDGDNFSAQFSTDGGATWSLLNCQSLLRYSWDCALPAGANKLQAKATPDPSNPGGLAVDIVLE